MSFHEGIQQAATFWRQYPLRNETLEKCDTFEECEAHSLLAVPLRHSFAVLIRIWSFSGVMNQIL